MPKVSRLPLRNEVWITIFDQLIETLANFKNKNEFSDFLDDFLSPTEKIMLAKRLACAVLIAKKHNYASIRRILRLSPPTISKISAKVRYEGKGINRVIERIFKKQAARIVWEELVDIFDLPTKSTLKSPERFKRKVAREKKMKRIKEEF